MFGIVNCGSHNPEAMKIVAERQWDGSLHQRVFFQLLGLGKRDVTIGHVYMKHAGEDQLNRAAFGTDYQINTFEITLKTLLDLLTDMDKGDNDCNAKRKDEDIEYIAYGIMAQAGET